MSSPVVDEDSPLSITANIAGILTFLVAIAAAGYARIAYLRNSDDEFFRVKAALAWYKTESAWLQDLVRAGANPASPASSEFSLVSTLTSSTAIDGTACAEPTAQDGAGHTSEKPRPANEFSRHGARPRRTRGPEYEMCAFLMDDLVTLEERLLELIEETEVRATNAENGSGDLGDGGNRKLGQRGMSLVPRSWMFTTGVAVAWLPVRKKALDLVRMRDALTARVQFAQMSIISSRIRDLESTARWTDVTTRDAIARLELQATQQRDHIRQLENAMLRLAGPDRRPTEGWSSLGVS